MSECITHHACDCITQRMQQLTEALRACVKQWEHNGKCEVQLREARALLAELDRPQSRLFLD